MFGSEPSGPSGPSGPPFDTRPVAAACTAQPPRASKRSVQCRPPTRAVAEVRALSVTTWSGASNMLSEQARHGKRPRWRAVRTTLDSTCPVSAPLRRVRLPPHTLRMTTAGRIAYSARQLVASILESRRKSALTAGEYVGEVPRKALGVHCSTAAESRSADRAVGLRVEARSASRPRRCQFARSGRGPATSRTASRTALTSAPQGL